MSSESVEVLFSKHGIEEIRDVEKKTRLEIETKKEDLRQMVGERYRDLIEAADTIAEMKVCAGNLSGAVKSLQKYTQMKFGHGDSGKKDKHRGFSVERFMEISAQVKLIMEVSETIWSQIENGNMIEATHLYLQSRQVLKNLNLDGSTTYCPILSWFPVLGQQAQALDNLRTTILGECRNLMSDDRLDSAVLAEAICSTILLENKTIENAFDEFMQIRLSAVTSKYESALDMGAAKLSKAVVVMISTLKQVNTLFVSSYECNMDQSDTGDQKPVHTGKDSLSDIGLVQHVLRKAFHSFHENTKQVGILSNNFSEEKIWAKHLPESVSKLILVSDLTSESSLEISKLQEKCRQWVEDCENVIRNGTSNILLYVTSFKGLRALRESLWETLHKESADVHVSSVDTLRNDSVVSNDTTTDWQRACVCTLGRYFSIWECVLKELFLAKVKVLCENLFSDLLVAAKRDIKEAIEGILSDSKDQTCLSVSEFIWRESPGDILPDTAWRQVSIKKTRDLKGGLGLKALSVTPALQQVCQRLNNAVKQTILDLSNYMPDITTNNKQAPKKSNQQRQVGVISQSESTVIHKYFQESCSQCLRDLFNIFKEYSKCYCAESSAENINPHEILFLSNFCRNFCYLCNEFYNGCVLGDNTEEMAFKRQLSSSMTSSVSFESGHTATSVIWDEISKQFLVESNEFLKMWSTMIIKREMKKFHAWLLNFASPALFFETIPCWDNIKIEEESETGSKVESEIKIPMSCSWPIQELLFSICNSLGRVGGHSFNQYALRHITRCLLAGILHSFIELKNTIMQKDRENESTDKGDIAQFQPAQSWALQKLFDLKVCHGVLHLTTSANFDEEQLFEIQEDAFDTLVDWLEGYIDPFDLDVFTPYLTKNVQRAVNSTRSLFGFISVDKGDFQQHTNQSSKSGSHSHNIMPLVQDCPRFSYLPISTKTSRRDKMELPASVKNSMPLSSALKQLTEVDKKMEGGRKQSLYSKLGALSSSWLSSVTSEN